MIEEDIEIKITQEKEIKLNIPKVHTNFTYKGKDILWYQEHLNEVFQCEDCLKKIKRKNCYGFSGELDKYCQECYHKRLYETCKHCGGQAKLEPKDDSEISGDVCHICDDWVCQKCLDLVYMKKILTVDSICKQCGEHEREEEKMTKGIVIFAPSNTGKSSLIEYIKMARQGNLHAITILNKIKENRGMKE